MKRANIFPWGALVDGGEDKLRADSAVGGEASALAGCHMMEKGFCYLVYCWIWLHHVLRETTCHHSQGFKGKTNETSDITP